MIITLTTDFGLSDPFVGIMKGVILGISPHARIVDITHAITAYDSGEAAFLIHTAYRYFPEGTIHVLVVDPGVGSARRPLAAFAGGHYFVAPDNGVASFVLHAEPPEPVAQVYQISNPRLFPGPVSRTFHGRDIFAPTAARLGSGFPLAEVGPRVLDFRSEAVPRVRAREPAGLLATVLRVDRFGNIITNLRRDDLSGSFCIRIAGREVTRLYNCFADADPGEIFAIEGSAGYVEIAMNRGSAGERLEVARGVEIEVETGRPNL